MLTERSRILRAPLGLSMGLGLGVGNGFSGSVTPQLLNVSNRSRLNLSVAASTATWSSVSYHNLFCGAGRSLTSLSVAWANWYCPANAELGSGGTLSIKLFIEYPIGVSPRKQVTWGGSGTGTIANLTTQYCDVTTLDTPIPNGAKVGIWAEVVPSVAIVFASGSAKSTTWGDVVSATNSGMSATSAKPTNGGGAYQGPISIRGLTTATSAVGIGDSRFAGTTGDPATSDGFSGQIQHTFGANYAILNLGCPGETGAQFLANSTLRRALLGDANYAIYEYGINDLAFGGGTAAAAEATASSVKALLPVGMRKTRATIVVASDSPGNWTAADGSDQTLKSYDAQRRALNTLILANGGGWDAIYDFAPVNEMATYPSGKWKADGTAHKYTIDGIHETTFANQQYAAVFPTLL